MDYVSQTTPKRHRIRRLNSSNSRSSGISRRRNLNELDGCQGSKCFDFSRNDHEWDDEDHNDEDFGVHSDLKDYLRVKGNLGVNSGEKVQINKEYMLCGKCKEKVGVRSGNSNLRDEPIFDIQGQLYIQPGYGVKTVKDAVENSVLNLSPRKLIYDDETRGGMVEGWKLNNGKILRKRVISHRKRRSNSDKISNELIHSRNNKSAKPGDSLDIRTFLKLSVRFMIHVVSALPFNKFKSLLVKCFMLMITSARKFVLFILTLCLKGCCVIYKLIFTTGKNINEFASKLNFQSLGHNYLLNSNFSVSDSESEASETEESENRLGEVQQSEFSMSETEYETDPDFDYETQLYCLRVATKLLARKTSLDWETLCRNEMFRREFEAKYGDGCAICLQGWKSDEATRCKTNGIKALSCGHAYHEECIFKWCAFGNITCPVCRTEL